MLSATGLEVRGWCGGFYDGSCLNGTIHAKSLSLSFSVGVCWV